MEPLEAMHASPEEVAGALREMVFPTDRHEMREYVVVRGAPVEVILTVQALRPGEYRSLEDVKEEVDRLIQTINASQRRADSAQSNSDQAA